MRFFVHEAAGRCGWLGCADNHRLRGLSAPPPRPAAQAGPPEDIFKTKVAGRAAALPRQGAVDVINSTDT